MRSNHIKNILNRASVKVIYSALLLYYAFKRPDLPTWAKSIIIGVIGYLLSPIDSIPDLTPIIGYTDDLGLLTYALVLIAAYINHEVRNNARIKLRKWCKHPIADKDLAAVETIL